MYYWFVIYVGVNALLVTLLAMNVSYKRIKYKIANGDGGNVELKKSIRAHGNAVEHSVLFALVVLALAIQGASAFEQSAFVIGFTIARVLHSVGMVNSIFGIRRIAAGLTYFFELSACVVVLFMITQS